jgi:hypothetical protein
MIRRQQQRQWLVRWWIVIIGCVIGMAATGSWLILRSGGFDPGASSYFAAVTAAGGTISASRQVLYNNLFTSLRSAGLLAKLDRLGIFAAENTTTARIDLANPSLSVTIVNAPTFTVDQGYANILGTASYINTGAIPGSLTNFQQNSAMFGVGTLSTRSTNSDFSIMGTTQNAGGSTLWLRTGIGTTAYNANSSGIFNGTVTIPVANVKGLYNVNRSAAAAQQLYMNGASVGTNTEPSAAMLAFSFLVGAFRNADNVSVYAYDTGIVSVYYIGDSFTASEAASFATIINTYMTAVGSPLF